VNAVLLGKVEQHPSARDLCAAGIVGAIGSRAGNRRGMRIAQGLSPVISLSSWKKPFFRSLLMFQFTGTL